MSCIVERHHDLTWYCCKCKEGPLNPKLCEKCECGHERCETYNFPLTPVDSEDDSSAKNQKEEKRRAFKLPLKQGTSLAANLNPSLATKEIRSLNPIGRSGRINGTLDAKIQLTPQIHNIDPYNSPAASTTSWETVSSQSPCSSTISSEDEGENENDEIELRRPAQARCSAKQNPDFKVDGSSVTFFDSICDGESGVISVPNVSMTGNYSTSGSRDRTGKRSRGDRSHLDKDDEDDEDEDEDEDDDRKKRPRSVQLASDKQEQSANFACPFIKYSYTMYSMTSCRNHSSTIPRLKEHLYRKHSIYPCQRCKVGFLTTSELDDHLQVNPACEYMGSISENLVQGVTPDMKEKIKNRRGLHLLSKPRQWHGIYKIIFGTDCTLSPFFHNVDNGGSQRHQENPNRMVREFAQRLLPMFEILMEQHLRGTEEVETGRLLESLDKPTIESAIQTALNQLLPRHSTSSLEFSSESMSQEDMTMVDQNTPAALLHENNSYTEFTDHYAELQRTKPSQTLASDASPSAFRDSFNSNDTISFNSIEQDTDFQPSAIIPASQPFAYEDTYIAEPEYTKSNRLLDASAVSFLLDHGYDSACLGNFLDPGELFQDDVAGRGYACNLGTGDEGNDGMLYGDLDVD